MTILKTKSKKGYRTITLEHVTLKDAQKSLTYTGYIVAKDGEHVSPLYSNKKDATSRFKRECERAFGPMSIEKRRY